MPSQLGVAQWLLLGMNCLAHPHPMNALKASQDTTRHQNQTITIIHSGSFLAIQIIAIFCTIFVCLYDFAA